MKATLKKILGLWMLLIGMLISQQVYAYQFNVVPDVPYRPPIEAVAYSQSQYKAVFALQEGGSNGGMGRSYGPEKLYRATIAKKAARALPFTPRSLL